MPEVGGGPAEKRTADEWNEQLATACRGEGLEAAYQPIVSTAQGIVVGYEALARFPGYSEKNPEAWFAAARMRGKSAQLESMALQTALKQRGSLPTNCFLTVNVSPELLFTEDVRSVWREQGDLSGLVIELTEQSPIDSYLKLEPDLNQLRAAGALIAIDDAGAGYAGLRHLLSLRPSMIKLDRDLIQDVDRDETKRALIEMLGTFASRVDAWILAEGVEREGELDALVALGVPLVQGYYLARPGPPWASIDVDLAHRLASRQPTSDGDTVRALLESTTTATSVEHAASCFIDNPELSLVVLLQGGQRPVAVLDENAARLGVVSQDMKVNVDTSISEALARSMTRDQPHRFGPLLVTDNAGRFVGIARMERLITALSASTMQ